MNDLVLQVTYDQLQIGVVRDGQFIFTAAEDKYSICKHNVLLIERALTATQLTLSDLRFIVINQGPAPFTSLRIGITTVNGIAFAAGVRLIGVGALEAFSAAYANDVARPVVLLNAFNQDLYCALRSADGTVFVTCASKEQVARMVLEQYPDHQIYVTGNGYDIIAPYMQETHGIIVRKADNFLPYPTLEMIYAYAQPQIDQQKYTNEVLPIYLKKFAYKPSC